MSLDSFFPAKDRFALAMRLNNLLAAPGFESWLQGEALNTKSLLYTDAGKPKISVMSIAHLDDAQRMFFVSMLLNDIIGWMRAQPGTSSLRAILYMDEMFGFMPPVANPPAKKLFLTLLKQARAYGLGLVLSTQNPVDLDYKGLSNTGTWFIGRLQTERDKARVMEGLEGASQGGSFDKGAMERTLAGLGKRRFLLHNVHENEAVVFGTRWVMSYLAGPLTRDHIKALMAKIKAGRDAVVKAASKPRRRSNEVAPSLPPEVTQYFVAASGDDLVYHPRFLAAAELTFNSARYNVEAERNVLYTVDIDDGPVAVDWDNGEPLALSVDALQTDASEGATFADVPACVGKAKNHTKWERTFKRWIRQHECVSLYRSKRFKLTSTPDETEGDFRIRLQDLASEQRDQAIAKLRNRYASKTTVLENRLLRARQTVEREQQQSTKKNFDTAISFGTAILGAVLGRKRLSSATTTRMGSAMKTAGGARKEAADIKRAKQTEEKVRAELVALDQKLQLEVGALNTRFNAQAEELDEITIRAKSTDVFVPVIGLVWMPYRADEKRRLRPAWEETPT